MRQTFIIFAKLIGLLQVFWSLAQLAPLTYLLTASTQYATGDGPEFSWAVVVTLVQILGAMAIAWLLLIKTEAIADWLDLRDDGAPTIPSAQNLLFVGIKLIGLYVLVTAIPEVIHAVIDPFRNGGFHQGPAITLKAIPPAAKLFFGALLLARTTVVVHWLTPAEEG